MGWRGDVLKTGNGFPLATVFQARWVLALAWIISCVVHLAVVFSPGWNLPEPPGDALRLKAELAVVTPEGAVPAPAQKKVAAGKKHRPPSKPAKNVEQAALPPVPDEAEQSSPAALTPEQSAVLADASAVASAPAAAESSPVAQVSQSAPAETSSAPAQSVAERLPRQGKVNYTGTASVLSVIGVVSWTHDGQHYQAQLGAGMLGASSSFNYQSSGSFGPTQLIAGQSRDDRRGKISTAMIDNANGVVRMERGGDQRERRISGLAVPLSSLPVALACLDERIEKAALFIVGDFWVEDAVVINRGMEHLRLPETVVEARHFQSKINNGKNIDIWLVPEWQNAPARIRYDDGHVVVDLKATDVEIDGKTLLKSASASN